MARRLRLYAARQHLPDRHGRDTRRRCRLRSWLTTNSAKRPDRQSGRSRGMIGRALCTAQMALRLPAEAKRKDKAVAEPGVTVGLNVRKVLAHRPPPTPQEKIWGGYTCWPRCGI